LSVLSLAYFATGIIRNRVFANTYGAGAELDAYNAAFRIPEIALDVLVAAGLTAPFVPIYSRLRHDTGDEPANDFGRTVLTGAVGLMTIASVASSSPHRGWPASSPKVSIPRPRTCTSSFCGSTVSHR
jgi:peptidoglycan biosynthesis protein MviN/MurJ (putative lipid II flippase)